jgi:branched-chain amino acid transport system permease protein
MGELKQTLLPVLGFLAVLLALPQFLTNDYYVSVLLISAINAIIVVGLNMLLGYAGQISLGHAAFYGLASYTSGIATTTFMLPIWAGALLALALVCVVAFLIGIPTLKLSGHYLAMATLGFGIIVFIVFNESIDLTGGPSGFVGIPRFSLFGYTFDSDLSYYYLTATVLALVVLGSLHLIHSRVGRALRAIHTSEKAAQVSGIDIAKYKLLVFVLSALYAGIAGVLYAHYLCFVAPSSFGFPFSVVLVTMVVLGGMSSIWGAVLGAFFLTVLPQFLHVFEKYEVLIFGCILVVCMMFLPGGLAGGFGKLWRLSRRGFRKSVAGEAQGGRHD